jgi:hypothetical protein
MKRTLQWTTLALALTLIGGLVNDSEAQRRGPKQQTRALQIDENADGIADGRALRGNLSGVSGQLSDEQRTALKSEVDALREAGASAEEITAAVVTQLAAAGIELPENFAAEHTAHVAERQAQAAQREEMRTIVDGLKEEGATREEIAAALADAGFEIPTRGHRGHRGHRGERPADIAAPSTGGE